MIPRRIRQDFERSNGVLSSVSSYSTSTSFFALCIVVEVLSFVLYAIYIRGMLPLYNKRVILDESGKDEAKDRLFIGLEIPDLFGLGSIRVDLRYTKESFVHSLHPIPIFGRELLLDRGQPRGYRLPR